MLLFPIKNRQILNQLPDTFIDDLNTWAEQLGFQQLAVARSELAEHEAHLNSWLGKQFHGDMDYMARHGNKRSRPAELEPGTISVISVRMDYFPPDSAAIQQVLDDPHLGLV